MLQVVVILSSFSANILLAICFAHNSNISPNCTQCKGYFNIILSIDDNYMKSLEKKMKLFYEINRCAHKTMIV